MKRRVGIEVGEAEVLLVEEGAEAGKRVPYGEGELAAVLRRLRSEYGNADAVVTSTVLPLSIGPYPAAQRVSAVWEEAGGAELSSPLAECEELLRAMGSWRCERLVPWPIALVEGRTAGVAVVAVKDRACLVVSAGKPWQAVRRQVAADAPVSELASAIALPLKTWGAVTEVLLLAERGDEIGPALAAAVGAPVRSIETAHPEFALASAALRATAAADLRSEAYREAADSSARLASRRRWSARALTGASAVLALSLAVTLTAHHRESGAQSILSSSEVSAARQIVSVNAELERRLAQMAVPARPAAWGKALVELGDAVPSGLWLDEVEVSARPGSGVSALVRGRSVGKSSVLVLLSQLEASGSWRNLSLRNAASETGPQTESYVRFELAGERP